MTGGAESETKQTPRGGSVAHGAGLMVGMRVASRLIGIVSMAILARLLTPDDFGLVVIGSSVQNVIGGLSELGLGAALIRMRESARAHYDTAWTIGVMRGALMAVVMVATAPAVATWMADQRVVPILWTLAAAVFIGSFENIRLVEFQVELRYGPLFRYQFFGRIVSFAATLTLAVILRSYWALVFSTLIQTVIGICYSYWLRPYRPRLTLVAWRDLFAFSKWQLIASYLVVVDNYSLNFLMGWLGQARSLGLYQVSAQIAALPASEIAAPIRPPMYAGFAKLQHDRPALGRAFVEGFGFLCLVITPMSLGIFAIASMITPLALGPHWADATPMIEAVVFYALFDAYWHYTGALFVVLNRQPRLILLTVVFLIVRVPAAIIGGYLGGAIGAVYGMAGSAVFGSVYWFATSLALLDLPATVLWRVLWRTAAACCAMLAVLLPLRHYWPTEPDVGRVAVQMLVFIVLGASVHIGVQLLLWWASGLPDGPESRALEFARGALRRLKLPRPAFLRP